MGIQKQNIISIFTATKNMRFFYVNLTISVLQIKQ